MEGQIDDIVLPILQQSGCILPKGIDSIDKFNADILLDCVVHLLRIINPKVKLSSTWPSGKSGQFRLGSKLSSQFLKLDYADEMGYQVFLYPEVSNTRKLLMFLVEKLPKDDEEEEEEVLGANQLFSQQIRKSLKGWMGQEWSKLGRLLNAKKGEMSQFKPVDLVIPTDKSEGSFWESDIDYAPKQSGKRQLSSSLITYNSSMIVKQLGIDSQFEEDEEEDVKAEIANLSQRIADSFSSAIQGAADEGSGSLWRSHSLKETDMEDIIQSGASSAFQRRANFTTSKTTIKAAVVDDSGNVQQVDETGEIIKEEDEEEIVKQREEQLSMMTEKIRKVQKKLVEMDQAINLEEGKLKALKQEVVSEEQKSELLEKEFRSKKVALDLLPNYEQNLQKLFQVVENTKKKLLKLGEEWEKHRTGLLEEYRTLKRAKDDRKLGAKRKMDELKKIRVEMKGMAHQVRDKEEVYQSLMSEWERMPKSVNRSVYVNRIMDIVKNLKKQKEQIRVILKDVNDIQKETDRLSNTSHRSYTVTDDLLYKTADAERNKDVKAEYTQIYKNLVSMRANFEKLIDFNRQKGNIDNEIRDMQNRIDQLEARNDTLNMSRLKEDLGSLREENDALEAKLGK